VFVQRELLKLTRSEAVTCPCSAQGFSCGRAVKLLLCLVGVEKFGTTFRVLTGLSPNESVLGVLALADVAMDGASIPSVLESPLSWPKGDLPSRLLIAVPGRISFSVSIAAAGFFHMLS
jgi:hypothetical protein